MAAGSGTIDETTERLEAFLEARGGNHRAPGVRGPTKRSRGGGPSPLLVIGVAFAIGFAAARIVAWRGDAHPRR